MQYSILQVFPNKEISVKACTNTLTTFQKWHPNLLSLFGFPSHNMYKHVTHLLEMVTLYFQKRQLPMMPSGDPITCTM
jgi:hypothetical protein